MKIPANPQLYHITHIDRLASIIADGCLWSDAEAIRRSSPGTKIGLDKIKQRRLHELTLTTHPDLHVGECVPFYFCPRSVMLYIIYQRNHPDLTYRDGQDSILHIEADLKRTVAWAEEAKVRWAFTLSNAGSTYFEDRCSLDQLAEINWDAVQALDWRAHKEGKQAEFLIERLFPWDLISRIGVLTNAAYLQVVSALRDAKSKPRVERIPDWYY